MKKLLTGIAMTLAGTCAQAAYLDVIAFEMTGECSFGEYMEVVGDFNEWAEPHGYNATVLMPMSSNDLDTFFWVGTSADAAVFGAAYEMWLKELGNDDSVPSDLNERFQECSTNMQRNTYHSY